LTKLGWTILTLIVLSVLAFESMLSFGSGNGPSPVARVKARFEKATPNDLGLVIPVAGVARASLVDTWGAPRGGGTRHHEAVDIMAPGGTPVVAAAAGTVEKLFQSDAGGVTAYVRSPSRGWVYYYAHLSGYAPGLAEGKRLAAGDPVGFVGDTGNAAPGNTHLHFGVSRMSAGDGWWQGEPVNPYPLLAGKASPR
jgi:peptidoglycan LD-endopeptidase LytH